MTDQLNRLFDMCQETKKEVVQTRLEVATLAGNVGILSTKIEGLAPSEDLTEKMNVAKDFARDEILKHEQRCKGKRSGGQLQINMPFKIGLAFAGGGGVLYLLLKQFFGVQ